MGVTPDQLLVHDAFVRGVARGILGEDAEVDDVVQETWIRALDAPPRKKGSLRSWLGVVSRSLSLRAIRARRRRRNREVVNAQKEKVPSTDHIVACEEIRRRLVKAMLGLDEEYRSVIVLRYYDGLPPREISRKLGLPVETVKTRIKRGVARLRTTLEKEHPGDRRQWLGALALLADPRRQGPADGLTRLAKLAGLVAGSLLAISSLVPAPLPGRPVSPSVADATEVAAIVPAVPSTARIPKAADARVLEAPRESLLRCAPAPATLGPRAARLHDHGDLLAPAVARKTGGDHPDAEEFVFHEDRIVQTFSGPVRIVLAGKPAVDRDVPLGEVILIVGGDVATASDLCIEIPGHEAGRGPEPEDLPDGRFRIRLRLPLGSYDVGSNDPEVWVTPTRIVVDPGPARTFELTVSRQVARFQLRPDEFARPVEELAAGRLSLVPVTGDGKETSVVVDEAGVATVRGLKTGEYEVYYAWPEHEPDGSIFLGAVELSLGSSGHVFTVPSERR